MVKPREIIVIENNSKEAATPGCASSGEGSWTRHAAMGHPVDGQPTRDRNYFSKLDVLIQHERKMVAKMEGKAIAARGTPSHVALCSKLQSLRFFLRKLESEQRELTP
jgi:hypothetical protein